MDRLGNLLNAASTAISDAQTVEVLKISGINPSATATILTLGQHSGQNLAELASTVGISHSAMVRLIDSLVGQGLVMRCSGRDRREVATTLTEMGNDLYGRLRDAQGKVLHPLLACLSTREHEAMECILSQILGALTKSPESGIASAASVTSKLVLKNPCPVEVRARYLASQ